MQLWTKLFWQHYIELCMPVSLLLWLVHLVEPRITAGLYTMPLWAPLMLYIITIIIKEKK